MKNNKESIEKLDQQLEALNQGNNLPRFEDTDEEADLTLLARALKSQGNKETDEEAINRVREELKISSPDLEIDVEDPSRDKKSFWTFQMVFSMGMLILVLGASAWFYFYQSNKISEIADSKKTGQNNEITVGADDDQLRPGTLPETDEASEQTVAIAKLTSEVEKYNATLNWEEPIGEISQTVSDEKDALAEQGYGAGIAISPFVDKTEDLVLDIQNAFYSLQESLNQAKNTLNSVPENIDIDEINTNFEQTNEVFIQTQEIYDQILDLYQNQESISEEQYSEFLDLVDEFTQNANNFQAEGQMLITKLNLLYNDLLD